MFGAVAQRNVALEVDARVEALLAGGATEGALAAVGLLVVDHVAQLGRFYMTGHALEKLVSSPRLLVDHILLHEAHVASVLAVSVAHALLDAAVARHLRTAHVEGAVLVLASGFLLLGCRSFLSFFADLNFYLRLAVVGGGDARGLSMHPVRGRRHQNLGAVQAGCGVEPAHILAQDLGGLGWSVSQRMHQLLAHGLERYFPGC